MIQDILLPEKIGSYYLFGKRVVGIEITKTHVYATLVYAAGSQLTVDRSFETVIEQHNGDSAPARTATALKKILTLIGKYDEIRFAISSAHIIFKTMQLPFDDRNKIKKVIDFEAEPLLPFTVADAIIDFIVTKVNPEQHTSEVLVAAAQKPYIAQQLEAFNLIERLPDVLSIDLFELYGLYALMHQNTKGNVVLLEITPEHTKMLFLTNGQLRFIRTIPVAVDITKKNNHEQRDYMPSTGEPQPAEPSIKEPFVGAKAFADTLLFTLQSFTAQAHTEAEPPKLLLLGEGSTLPGFVAWLQQALQVPCALFNPMEIRDRPHIKIKAGIIIPNTNVISAAVALSSPTTEGVNMRQKEFAPKTERLLLKQLICACVLLLSIFIALFTHSYLQKRVLRRELASSKAETTRVLHEHFPTIEKGPIDDMLEEASKENQKDEQTWFAFKRSARNSLLNLLLELTRLNREGLGLVIDKISIDQERNIMMLKAQVKDHEALVRLENELKQSNLFSSIQPQNDINFNMELHLKADREGGS